MEIINKDDLNNVDDSKLKKQTSTLVRSTDNILDFEIRSCVQSIRANTELIKYLKIQTLDHSMIAFLEKIEFNCMQIDNHINDCLESCHHEAGIRDNFSSSGQK